LGKTYRDIFARGNPLMMRAEIRALIILTLKVINMNILGFSHNDISEANITYKDGKAYLIDIGLFTYRPGEHLFQDLFDLLNILFRYGVDINETYRTRLQAFTAISIKDKHIQDIKALLLEMLEVLTSARGTAPRLPIYNRNVEKANAGGARRRRNRTKKQAKAKTTTKKSLRRALK
jgi:serine/threonine-protein kinase RIO1